MLKLEKLCKEYRLPSMVVNALVDVDLCFRKNEFVSILGPSGCGKTTMLNMIGGLDNYTAGNLYINGKDTKDFTSREWDTYRNRRVGFIFQSYNLISHQSVLTNVELALSIAGVGKKERTQRAKDALDKVGLKGEYYKKPGQLSGGQSQRVAIARALINDPEVLLADEPTGALDSVTSVSVMELIKEIAKERLVIMVTHNPELANEYSTRIIKLLDGRVVSDTNPFSVEEQAAEVEELKALPKKEKAKMKFKTTFGLSFSNLLTKKLRTILTAVAGSIGIIGVSLVLAIRTGVNDYIKDMQEDMLSGNPIGISESTYDLSGIMGGNDRTPSRFQLTRDMITDGYAGIRSYIEFLLVGKNAANNAMVRNDLTAEYIAYVNDLKTKTTDKGVPLVETIFNNYSLNILNNIYTDFSVYEKSNPLYQTDVISDRMSLAAIKSIYTAILQDDDEYGGYASFITNIETTFYQLMDNTSYLESQYNPVRGSKMPTNKNEVMLVLDRRNSVSDLLLALLGYYSQEEFLNLCYFVTEDDKYIEGETVLTREISYDTLLGKKFTYYPNDSIYKKNPHPIHSITNPFFHINKEKDILNYSEIGMDLVVTGIWIAKENSSYGSLSSGFYYTDEFVQHFIDQNYESELVKYFNNNKITTYMSNASFGGTYIKGISFDFEYASFDFEIKSTTGFIGSMQTMGIMLGELMPGIGDLLRNESYTLRLNEIGGSKLPVNMMVYPTDFTSKQEVLKHLNAWNEEGDVSFIFEGNLKTLSFEDRSKVVYDDALSFIIEMITEFVDIVAFVLIGFAALALVVSCVMIAIITFVSVLERTKEIGIIRSIGGSKLDVSNLFNAETFMIGFLSGSIGIGVTLLVSGLINLILKYAPIAVDKMARLTWFEGSVMMLISIFLMMISGLLPAFSAAKKDPAVALRTE